MADWVSIKADYVSGGGSYSELAEKHGVSLSSIKHHAADEGWKRHRTEVAPKLHRKTVQKVIEKKSSQEADRITRLLGIGDDLTKKLEKAADELGTYVIVKRKSEHVIRDKNGKPQVVEDTVEVAQKTEAVVCTADLKRLTSALKDLHEIIKLPEDKDGNDVEDLTPLAELLGDRHE